MGLNHKFVSWQIYHHTLYCYMPSKWWDIGILEKKKLKWSKLHLNVTWFNIAHKIVWERFVILICESKLIKWNGRRCIHEPIYKSGGVLTPGRISGRISVRNPNKLSWMRFDAMVDAIFFICMNDWITDWTFTIVYKRTFHKACNHQHHSRLYIQGFFFLYPSLTCILKSE